MWEWEAPPDDPTGPSQENVDLAAELAEQRLTDIERRKEQARLEQQINSVIENRIEALNKSISLTKSELETIIAMTRDYGALQEQAEQLLKVKMELEATPAVSDEEKAKLVEARAAYEAAAKAADAYKTKMVEQAQSLIDTKQVSGQLKKQTAKLIEDFQAGNITAEEFAEGMDKIRVGMDYVTDAVQRADRGLSSTLSKIGVTAKVGDTGFGRLLEGATRLAVGIAKGPRAAFIGLASSALNLFSPLNMLGMVLKFAFESFKETEEAAIGLSKAFGGSVVEMQKDLQALQGSLRKFNMTVGEFSQSGIAMRQAISGFDPLSEAGQKLATTTGLMGKLGVDQKLLGQQIQKLRFQFSGLNGNIEESQKSLVTMTLRARQMGVDVTRAMSDFSQFSGAIAGMGGNLNEEFEKTLAISRATGAEMSKLVSIAKKFNTFKDGADMAAKLNSVFGTSISSIELMGKTLPERNQIISDSLQMATGGFSAMTQHQQIAAAEILGFGDDLLGLQGYMEGMSAAQKEQEQANIENANAMAQLQQATMGIVPVLTQLINKVRETFENSEGVKVAFESIIAALPTLIDLVEILTSIFGYMADNMKKSIFAFGAIKAAMAANTAGFAAYNAALMSTAVVEGGASASKIALAAAGRAALSSMIPFVLVLGALYLAYTLSGSPKLYAMAGFMAIGVLALGAAFYFAGPALNAAIPALVVIMAGMVGIFYVLPPLIEAIGGLVDSVTNMFTAFAENVSVLYLMAGGLMAIGGGFFFLGNMAMLATLGIAAGTIALLALRATMALSGTSFKDMVDLGDGVSKMGEGIKNLKEGVSGLASAGASLMGALGNKSLVLRGDATGVTMVAGKGGMFAFVPPAIKVDVNIKDNIKMPTPIVNVQVQIDRDDLKHHVKAIYAESRD